MYFHLDLGELAHSVPILSVDGGVRFEIELLLREANRMEVKRTNPKIFELFLCRSILILTE